MPSSDQIYKYDSVFINNETWRDAQFTDLSISAMFVMIVVPSIFETPKGLMNMSILIYILLKIVCKLSAKPNVNPMT